MTNEARALIEAAESADEAVRLSYNVTPQILHAMKALRAAISSAKAAEEGVEAIPVNWAVSLAESTLTPSSNITQIRSVEKVVAALRKRS